VDNLKIYRYVINPVIKDVLAVDPAVVKAGFTYFNPKRNMLVTGEHTTEKKVMGKGFPQVLPIIKDSVLSLIGKIDQFLSENTDFIIETTYFHGLFSAGLSVFNALLLDQLLRERRVGRVTFVAPRICSFFMNKRKTTKMEHVKFVKELFPTIPKKFSSHEADSLMMVMACHWRTIQKQYGIIYRIPELDIMNVDIEGAYHGQEVEELETDS
jgi:hypothetical protein